MFGMAFSLMLLVTSGIGFYVERRHSGRSFAFKLTFT